MTVTHPYMEEMIRQDRFFQILYDVLKQSVYFDQVLTDKIFHYINEYAQFHSLSKEQMIEYYGTFVRGYDRDVKDFNKTNQYPLYSNRDVKQPTRIEYSTILLLSTVLTEHRYRIMQLINQLDSLGNSALFVGCGPGLEIELVKDKVSSISAYDLNTDEFVQFKHKGIELNEKRFDGTPREAFESIFLIEILEHLEDPYALLAHSHNALKKDGQVVLTTATNIPQFDHMYNFKADHIEFEKKVEDLGFTLESSCEIKHHMMTQHLEAQNKFYVLTKS